MLVKVGASISSILQQILFDEMLSALTHTIEALDRPWKEGES